MNWVSKHSLDHELINFLRFSSLSFILVLFKFLSFLQVKHPSASSSGVIALEFSILIHNLIILVDIVSSDISRFSYHFVFFNVKISLISLMLNECKRSSKMSGIGARLPRIALVERVCNCFQNLV